MSIRTFEKPVELLLASSSPRRRQIITLLGFPCLNAVVSEDEDAAQARYQGSVENMAQWLAKYKASIALKLPEAAGRLIITADTTVILENEALGKPRDEAHACQLLRRLRGRWHHVITGVVVCTELEGKTVMHSANCVTPVLMRNYSNAEIAAYIASGEAMDKAGAYGVQNASFQPTEHIDGCYFNVVGLPVCTLTDLLAEFGVYPSRQHLYSETNCPWSEKCQL
jgi:septum formation protein